MFTSMIADSPLLASVHAIAICVGTGENTQLTFLLSDGVCDPGSVPADWSEDSWNMGGCVVQAITLTVTVSMANHSKQENT